MCPILRLFSIFQLVLQAARFTFWFCFVVVIIIIIELHRVLVYTYSVYTFALLGDTLLLLEMLIIFGCLIILLHICRKDIRTHYKHVFQFLLSVGAKSFKEAFTNSRRLNWTKGTLLHLILVRFRLQTTHN